LFVALMVIPERRLLDFMVPKRARKLNFTTFVQPNSTERRRRSKMLFMIYLERSSGREALRGAIDFLMVQLRPPPRPGPRKDAFPEENVRLSTILWAPIIVKARNIQKFAFYHFEKLRFTSQKDDENVPQTSKKKNVDDDDGKRELLCLPLRSTAGCFCEIPSNADEDYTCALLKR
jgi:hypothetical protein